MERRAKRQMAMRNLDRNVSPACKGALKESGAPQPGSLLDASWTRIACSFRDRIDEEDGGGGHE
jgi:hypothetical protein